MCKSIKQFQYITSVDAYYDDDVDAVTPVSDSAFVASGWYKSYCRKGRGQVDVKKIKPMYTPFFEVLDGIQRVCLDNRVELTVQWMV